MNTDPRSLFVHALLHEHNGGNPIVIDQDILSDYDNKVRLKPCQWNGCTMHIALEHKHVAKHFQQRHGINTSATSEEAQKMSCLWLGCSDAQMKPGNIARHVLSAHLEVKWNCLTCGKPYTREDAFRRHTQEKMTCQYAKYFVSYGNGVIKIDTGCIAGGWSAGQNVLCIP
ncbi:hypothetical protein K503DRAFT_157565 [Rhizopogon vinicolor AM-OR11-026]|uniref:C2H2-type domain-containing protein n=1 Tax=Rhizopogon vinicolor AM-OR11-026 TaxID=1314800 RepID=A0A1B7N101_9AGAM|nr:hypothetical protein K503DRAFT_157565 [Rhizopogon vinicolor AM-OR11-026]